MQEFEIYSHWAFVGPRHKNSVFTFTERLSDPDTRIQRFTFTERLSDPDTRIRCLPSLNIVGPWHKNLEFTLITEHLWPGPWHKNLSGPWHKNSVFTFSLTLVGPWHKDLMSWNTEACTTETFGTFIVCRAPFGGLSFWYTIPMLTEECLVSSASPNFYIVTLCKWSGRSGFAQTTFHDPNLCMCEYILNLTVMNMDVQQQCTEHSFSKCPFDNLLSGDVLLFPCFPEWVATLWVGRSQLASTLLSGCDTYTQLSYTKSAINSM